MRAATASLCVVLLSACSLLTPVRMDITKHVIEGLPQDLAIGKTRPATLLVALPETQPAYDTTEMAYTTKAYQLAYFSENQWAEKPSHMLQPLLVETVRRTQLLRDIYTSPEVGRPSHILRTQIVRLRQDFTSTPPVAELAIRASLSREGSQVVATRDFSRRLPMLEGNPHAGVVALNQATVEILRDLAGFVAEKLR